MHLCVFCFAAQQLGEVVQAATAAETYAVFNPTNKDMQTNLKLYRGNADVQAANVTPSMHPSGKVLFGQATVYYGQQLYQKTASTMQSAIQMLVKEYETCHSNCDSEASTAFDEDSREQTTNFLDFALQLQLKQVTCRLRCWIDVGQGIGQYHPLDVVPDGYNYIQFSLNSGKPMDTGTCVV